MTIVTPTMTNGFNWKQARTNLAALLTAAAPLAKVHAEWKLEFDPATSLGKITALLKGLTDHENIVHSWMIGLAGVEPITGESGDDTYIGGVTSEYYLDFAVWGFFDYKGWLSNIAGTGLADSESENAVQAAENESRRVLAYVRANPSLADSGASAIAQPFRVENQDIQGFSGGSLVFVVQGALRVRVRESFA